MKKIELSNLSEWFFKNTDKIGKLSKLYRILLSLGILAALIGPFFYFAQTRYNWCIENGKRFAGNQTRQGKSKGRATETFSGEAQRGWDWIQNRKEKTSWKKRNTVSAVKHFKVWPGCRVGIYSVSAAAWNKQRFLCWNSGIDYGYRQLSQCRPLLWQIGKVIQDCKYKKH